MRLGAIALVSLVAFAALGAQAVQRAEAADGFTDVPDSSPFHDDIAWMADNAIASGYSDGTFQPGQVVTRQSMAAFMHRLSDLVEPGTTRVSVSSDSTQADLRANTPEISADGRHVAFSSDATNLVPGDTNGEKDIFVRDTLTGSTTRVSIASDGTQSNGGASYPSISADGRYIAFSSHATNFMPSDSNIKSDVFVHDTESGTTTLVSVSAAGTIANNGSSFPSISADGRYVAFESFASNLVPGDTNGTFDVFVHDTQSGSTTLVSVSSGGTHANSYSARASISADGRYVTFTSSGSNLVAGDTNGEEDVFVHDTQSGATTRVSVTSDGTQGNSYSQYPAISANGRYVTYCSVASNLVAGDTNGTFDVFVHDTQSGSTTLVSVSAAGTQGNNLSTTPSITADGGHIAFRSSASNLVPGDINSKSDVFVHDTQAGSTTLVSVSAGGTQGNSLSTLPSISDAGRYIAYQSDASNLVPDDTNGTEDVFRWDRGS